MLVPAALTRRSAMGKLRLLLALLPPTCCGWEVPANGSMLGRPTFAGGGRCVLVPIRATDSLVALDSASGAVLWRSALPGGGVSGQPVLGPGEATLFAGGGDSRLWALSLGAHPCAAGPSPRPLWNVSLGGHLDASPAVSADGRLVFAATDENKATRNGSQLYALDAATGALAWSFRPSCHPTLGCGFAKDGQRASGSPLYGAGFYSSPVYHRGVVYIGSEWGHIHALNASDGATVWEYAPPFVSKAGAPWVEGRCASAPPNSLASTTAAPAKLCRPLQLQELRVQHRRDRRRGTPALLRLRRLPHLLRGPSHRAPAVECQHGQPNH